MHQLVLHLSSCTSLPVFQAVTQLEGLDSPTGSLLTSAVMGGPVVFNDAQNISNPHWRGIQLPVTVFGSISVESG